MNRITSILKRARYSLSDLDGNRWSDERLLYLIDEAQKSFIHKSNSLKQIFNIDAIKDQKVYTLPDTIISIDRVEYKKNKLQFLDMDKFITLTDTIKEPKYCIYDKLDRNNFILYPAPSEDADNAITVFVTNLPSTIDSINSELQISPIYDNAIYYFVVYSALLDNQDTASLQVAAEFKNKYAIEFQYLFKESFKDFTNINSLNNYKGFI